MDNTQRDQQIAVEFLGGVSVPKLAAQYGLSQTHINLILKVQETDRSKRVKNLTEDKLIDRTHEILGQRLYHHRKFTNGEERTDCAKALGWSAKKVAMVEQGHVILTITDLKALATYMQKTLSQLVEDL